MASEDTGDNSDSSSAHGSISRESNKGASSTFQFRPSALSQVADKMWKNTTSTSDADGGHSTVLPLPKLAPAQQQNTTSNNNVFHSATSSQFIFGKNISNRVAHAANAGKDEENSGTANHSSDEDSGQRRDNGAGAHAENNAPTTTVTTTAGTGGFDVLAAASTAKMAAESSSESASTNKRSIYTSSSTSSKETAVISATTTNSSASEENAAASLAAAAALYEAAKKTAGKQPHLLLAPEEVKTGEEDEMNVLQASVKLFVFDAAKKSWTDRGMAIMRINDRPRPPQAGDEGGDGGGEFAETRIVVRLQGSLRVIVNTKLWPDMLLERVSQKRLRLSGTLVDTNDGAGSGNDTKQSPGITVYLISGSQSDVDRIERALHDRRDRLKSAGKSGGNGGGNGEVGAIAGKKRALQQQHTATTTSLSARDSDQEAESPANKKRELAGDQDDDDDN